ncbi:uncharacterized protein LOC109537989 [Dendroctonus ponderosae]|uniref:EB domain-containing protein n=1 Tax=Dendroctonus ponderosae TaxID=77166 RepID=A0AAR5PHN9_DENPD|nr:uncharacterized protein LOC109537989 [Dendroctonus ponderosae]
MNAFYVTLSIPLLLVLAGFNHAHGLTTFGKSTPNNQPPSMEKAKKCSGQSTCSLIKNTTCIKGFCLCGDNNPPVNAECSAVLQGPNHICTKHEDCVDNADCIPAKEANIPKENLLLLQDPNVSICKCQEGYRDTGATCGGNIRLSTIPFLLFALAICKLFY